jgi:hypothetical protein
MMHIWRISFNVANIAINTSVNEQRLLSYQPRDLPVSTRPIVPGTKLLRDLPVRFRPPLFLVGLL